MEKIIKELCRYLIKNIDKEVSLEELEELLHYSKYYIIRFFKEYTGYSIKDFVNQVKVLKTIDPLLFTDDTILKIALSNGFNSQEYYSETFKKIIGISPKKFKKEYSLLENDDIETLKQKKEYLKDLYKYKEYINNFEKKDENKVLKKVA